MSNLSDIESLRNAKTGEVLSIQKLALHLAHGIRWKVIIDRKPKHKTENNNFAAVWAFDEIKQWINSDCLCADFSICSLFNWFAFYMQLVTLLNSFNNYLFCNKKTTFASIRFVIEKIIIIRLNSMILEIFQEIAIYSNQHQTNS